MLPTHVEDAMYYLENEVCMALVSNPMPDDILDWSLARASKKYIEVTTNGPKELGEVVQAASAFLHLMNEYNRRKLEREKTAASKHN